jgi:hypothetical protein
MLERLSMKNVTWHFGGIGDKEAPLSQEAIIMKVRPTPSLRWLRSDLTEEYVAMLQKERPETTFDSD